LLEGEEGGGGQLNQMGSGAREVRPGRIVKLGWKMGGKGGGGGIGSKELTKSFGSLALPHCKNHGGRGIKGSKKSKFAGERESTPVRI